MRAKLSAMRTEIPLVSSVLHPTDFSDASNRAFAHALAIALLRQTELTILNVGEESKDDVAWSSFPQVRKILERWNLLEPGSARSAVYDELNVEVRKLAVRSRNPIRATIEFLDHQPHELVVLATEGSEGNHSRKTFSSAVTVNSTCLSPSTTFARAGASVPPRWNT